MNRVINLTHKKSKKFFEIFKLTLFISKKKSIELTKLTNLQKLRYFLQSQKFDFLDSTYNHSLNPFIKEQMQTLPDSETKNFYKEIFKIFGDTEQTEKMSEANHNCK